MRSDDDRRTEILRALKRYHAKLARKVEGLKGDFAEARRADEYRLNGETLLAYLRQVPARAGSVVLPDPSDPNRNLTIELDPAVTPQVNAARYFKRAAKAERGLKEVPPRLSAVEAEAHALEVLIARATALEEGESDSARPDDPTLDQGPLWRAKVPRTCPQSRRYSPSPLPSPAVKPVLPRRVFNRGASSQKKVGTC